MGGSYFGLQSGSDPRKKFSLGKMGVEMEMGDSGSHGGKLGVPHLGKSWTPTSTGSGVIT